MRLYAFAIVLFSLTLLDLTASQVPPRFSIPGALLVSSGPQRSSSSSASSRSRPSPSYLQDFPAPARRAKPSPNAIPVVEDVEDLPQQQSSLSSSSSAASSESSGSAAFDDEVARLGIGTLQAAAAVAAREEFQQQQQQPKFRPERPVPVLRQDVRESAAPQPQRQVFRESIGAARARQEARDEEENVPVVVRRPQPIRAAIPQDYRPSVRAQPAPQQSTRQQQQQIRYDPDDDPKRSKNRKPPVQILRKYRTDNDDGSITWGYENEDGTFKEETIGVDCIVRGKYGYTDPDGVRREYTYEAGGVCDPDPEEELALQDPRAQDPRAQAPLPKGGKKIYRLPV